MNHPESSTGPSSLAERIDSTTTSPTSSDFGSSPGAHLSALGQGKLAAKCAHCLSGSPPLKVLYCFHTFCLACLENLQDHPERVVCPSCQVETPLGPGGVTGLAMVATSGHSEDGEMWNYFNPLSSPPSLGLSKSIPVISSSNDKDAPSTLNFLPHDKSVLSPHLYPGSDQIDLEDMHKLLQKGKDKASEISSNMKQIKALAHGFENKLAQTQQQVKEEFKRYFMTLESQRSDVLRELDQLHSHRHAGISAYCDKSQETVEQIHHLTNFMERLVKSSPPGEATMFKSPIEQKMAALSLQMSKYDCILTNHVDYEFISNPNLMIASIKNGCGMVRPTRVENKEQDFSIHSSTQPPVQPSPISRPTARLGVNTTTFSSHALDYPKASTNTLCSGLAQGIATLAADSNDRKDLLHNGSRAFPSAEMQGTWTNSKDKEISTLSAMSSSLSDNSKTNYFLQTDFQPVKQFQRNMTPSAGGQMAQGNMLNAQLGQQFLRNTNSYERWSTGSNQFLPIGSKGESHPFSSNNGIAPINGTHFTIPGAAPTSFHDHLLDFSTKCGQQTDLVCPIPSSSSFPPKSHIKRQKMIYHCKFEPSGVAVNAQNDIIVADTNNHRIQIFDKEGRFKFQFGECGKRDGQLLYPNRVAVVRHSGDIIVTERSPTHQVQIYNQYGQFVRKFGANILQHPRGVCVDNRGRVIVVECKVMRVIIFDQLGNVLNKFGCSKHLEFPNGVVVNDRQEIFISDNRAHCVKVFNYDGTYLRQIGGEGITNYPIGVGINGAGEVTIADNHNNFNLSVFTQDGQLLSALESKVKHAQCFDVSLMDDGSVVLASKDYRLYIYRYIQVPPCAILVEKMMHMVVLQYPRAPDDAPTGPTRPTGRRAWGQKAKLDPEELKEVAQASPLQSLHSNAKDLGMSERSFGGPSRRPGARAW
eukprot:maker-scaffold396_size184579-snap-gene-0.21 protein:Tk06610 transcript:maker-scaffold396_size184579-snap-gene-0.21-mRNA-1 annotation:"brain tumor protein"